MTQHIRLSDIGEKRLIAEHIRPLFNPTGDPKGIGDDCAILEVPAGDVACISTDRVPADLISFRLGILDYRGLGYYLAVLNISDVAAVGGRPTGLLLNLAFPADFLLVDFLSLLDGVHAAAETYAVPVVGGDLSSSAEMNLTATILGAVERDRALLRSGARAGDLVFCCENIGVTATAFQYLLNGGQERLPLSLEEQEVLVRHFVRPTPQLELGAALSQSMCCTSAMDVTDGVAQSLSELAVSSGVAIDIDRGALPIAAVSRKVADHFALDVVDLVLGPGADFQLVGTIDPRHPAFSAIAKRVVIIGAVRSGSGLFLKDDNTLVPHTPKGWNYYKK